MKRRRTPECCDCNWWPSPSPWHCACGRWKPAAADRCETCTPVASVVRCDGREGAALELEWYFDNEWPVRQVLRGKAA